MMFTFLVAAFPAESK